MLSIPRQRIRNFCIIAHIDHGKSTLADRLLEYTNTISERKMQDQVLDKMDLEKERGITIKAKAVRMIYKADDGKEYLLNLIDTPGHVDFNYEVSRSLAACEGALLIVDASQGIEAQTLANTYLALEHNLEIIPIINKIDLPSAEPDEAKREVEEIIGLDAENAIMTSAKTGQGVKEVLEAIVQRIPAPEGCNELPLRALIFDSLYDPYKGAVAFVRVIDGHIRPKQMIKMMSTNNIFEVAEIGVFNPDMQPVQYLQAGEVGYVAAGIKNVIDTRVGDTITDAENPAKKPLPGYKKAVPMVFCGMYPAEGEEYESLKEALGKLQLSDASLFFEPETSAALGFGFRCGFLGLLHMDVVQERLEREYNLNIITTAPSVIFKVKKTDGSKIEVDNPTNFPDPAEIEYIEEPYVEASIMLPTEYMGAVMDLCQEKRGTMKDMEYINEKRVILRYDMPLSEIIYDLFDQLKSRTRGYASLDYELTGYKKSDMVKLDILLNGEIVDALSFIVHKDKAYGRARQITEKLKEVIPRHLFEVPIQAAIGGKIIARETVKALRKNVLAKCYGGDISRKKKLLEKQKEGKKRMRKIGNVELPQEAFMAVLKME
ncbi:ribosomal elongation factor, GTPase [Tepidanaerobacter acetatoxydans Re1]|uniref:Elongation factor 4 n=1 Tax=Tepidanaerobacter acetatoxydans (strain DSM 21804 / JCM 16047 / Re1) TaxID=1209989 RepID=F4LSH2_TEPAE|nr:translation elongation factor 4 [Tepidanaerobacter acetatoxydans]AEE91238.1 GTP-binding protein lepA [Tepidanaerobacter acetatoxydans Re1]CCP25916.1 ribosomal elongation factor, GTPase [Tepidanaerobacter acetatoxydans Re1]